MIRSLVGELNLNGAVQFKGHVSQEELYRYYAESRVFCLMSTCESFGIPAVEAQAFGTPVVSSNCCAIPEVCGEGGMYLEPGDHDSVAAQIARLLTNDDSWTQLSQAAKRNAERYRWDICSWPLLKIFDVISSQIRQG
jgi:glycosyltransferase involved in cell wall biosynthesis